MARSSLRRTLKRLNKKREEDKQMTPSMGGSSGSGGSPVDGASRQMLEDSSIPPRSNYVSGIDPNAPKDSRGNPRLEEVVGAKTTAEADQFLRKNPNDFVKMSPAVLEDRKKTPQYADVEGDTRVNKNLPKQFMDTAEGRKYFTPMAKGDPEAKYVPEFGTYGSLSGAEIIPQEGVRDVLPNFGTYDKDSAALFNQNLNKNFPNLSQEARNRMQVEAGDTMRKNPRAEEHRNFAAKIEEKGAGWWSKPENARALAALLNEAPSKGLNSSQVMKFIDKFDKSVKYKDDSAKGMDWIQGVVRSETGSDPADIAFSRNRAFPDQEGKKDILKKIKDQRKKNKRNKKRGGRKGEGRRGRKGEERRRRREDARDEDESFRGRRRQRR